VPNQDVVISILCSTNYRRRHQASLSWQFVRDAQQAQMAEKLIRMHGRHPTE
jgi:hypothetical protein